MALFGAETPSEPAQNNGQVRCAHDDGTTFMAYVPPFELTVAQGFNTIEQVRAWWYYVSDGASHHPYNPQGNYKGDSNPTRAYKINQIKQNQFDALGNLYDPIGEAISAVDKVTGQTYVKSGIGNVGDVGQLHVGPGALAPATGGYTWTWEPSTQGGQPGPRLIVKGPATIPSIGGGTGNAYFSESGDAHIAEWVYGQLGQPDIDILRAQAKAEIVARKGQSEGDTFDANPAEWIANNQLVNAHWITGGQGNEAHGTAGYAGHWQVDKWPPGPDPFAIIAGVGGVIAGAISSVFGGGGTALAISSGIELATSAHSNNPATSDATQLAAAKAQADQLQQDIADNARAQSGMGNPQFAAMPGGIALSRTAKVGIGIGLALLVAVGVGIALTTGEA